MEKVDSSNTDKLKYEEQLEFLRDHEKFLTTQVYLIVFNVFLNFQLFYFAQVESLLAEKDFQKQQLEGILSRQHKVTESKFTETDADNEDDNKINELNGLEKCFDFFSFITNFFI